MATKPASVKVKDKLSGKVKAELRERYNVIRFQQAPPPNIKVEGDHSAAMPEVMRLQEEHFTRHENAKLDRMNGFIDAVAIVLGKTREETRAWLEK